MADVQQEIQQLDKRINRVEIVLVNFTEDLKSLNDALKNATNEITKFSDAQHNAYDNIKAEIATTRNEFGRPNWSFWAIAVTIIFGFVTGGYWLIQSDIQHNQEIFDAHLSYQQQISELESKHLRELVDMKTRSTYGKN